MRGEGEEGRVRGGRGRESEGRRETIITTANLKMQYRVVVICTQIAALVQCGGYHAAVVVTGVGKYLPIHASVGLS